MLIYNGAPNLSTYRIGAAVTAADDLTGFDKWATNPVIAPGAGGQWDDDNVKDPWAVKDGSTVRVFYAGNDGTSYQIGVASATLANLETFDPATFAFTKSGSNPVVVRGGSGAWDEHHVAFPTVIHDSDDPDSGKRWKCWYAGAAAATPGKESIGYAYAANFDGPYTKHASNPVITPGAGGTYDDEGCGAPSVVRVDGDDWYLFYGGRPSTGGGVSGDAMCVATFASPEGTYTKHGSNPLLAPRSTTYALTGTTAGGSRVVTVASTVGLAANEPVLLRDSTNTVQQTRIASIDSATQVTLTDDASKAWTTANTASLRSAYYGSLNPRTVTQVDDTYVMFGSAFQQFGGTPAYERTVAATAPALTGPWTFDFTRGLVLPLGASWDSVSAENPSVVVL